MPRPWQSLFFAGVAWSKREAEYDWLYSYTGEREDFFSHFWFWESADPTHGHVIYKSREEAEAAGLIKPDSRPVYMGADMNHITDGSGRASVRLMSKAVFQEGLFVLQLEHVPTGCGTWPAFWLYGGGTKAEAQNGETYEQAHWPDWGEYDILEGVHQSGRTITTLHTDATCDQGHLLNLHNHDRPYVTVMGAPQSTEPSLPPPPPPTVGSLTLVPLFPENTNSGTASTAAAMGVSQNLMPATSSTTPSSAPPAAPPSPTTFSAPVMTPAPPTTTTFSPFAAPSAGPGLLVPLSPKAAAMKDFVGKDTQRRAEAVPTVTWSRGTNGRFADNCDVNASGQWHNQGCSQYGPPGSLGAPFNAGAGGTFAAEWDPEASHIRTWFWQYGDEPADLLNHHPRPDTWGSPYSYFKLDPVWCPASHFKDMRMAFDLTFCGDYAGATFARDCPAYAQQNMTCEEFVSEHPSQFEEAFWSIRALDVYQHNVEQPYQPLPTEHVSGTAAPKPAASTPKVKPTAQTATSPTANPATKPTAPQPVANPMQMPTAPQPAVNFTANPTTKPAAPHPTANPTANPTTQLATPPLSAKPAITKPTAKPLATMPAESNPVDTISKPAASTSVPEPQPTPAFPDSFFRPKPVVQPKRHPPPHPFPAAQTQRPGRGPSTLAVATIAGCMSVDNVDYAALSEDHSLRGAFETECRTSLANATGTPAEFVQIILSKGSIHVEYAITKDSSSASAATRAFANTIQGDFPQNLAGVLRTIPGIDDIVSGSITVTHLSEPVLIQPINNATAPPKDAVPVELFYLPSTVTFAFSATLILIVACALYGVRDQETLLACLAAGINSVDFVKAPESTAEDGQRVPASFSSGPPADDLGIGYSDTEGRHYTAHATSSPRPPPRKDGSSPGILGSTEKSDYTAIPDDCII